MMLHHDEVMIVEEDSEIYDLQICRVTYLNVLASVANVDKLSTPCLGSIAVYGLPNCVTLQYLFSRFDANRYFFYVLMIKGSNLWTGMLADCLLSKIFCRSLV